MGKICGIKKRYKTINHQNIGHHITPKCVVFLQIYPNFELFFHSKKNDNVFLLYISVGNNYGKKNQNISK